MTTQLPSEIISHTRRVQSLYKRALRNIQAFVFKRDMMRYYQVLLREEFDDNRCVDEKQGQCLIQKGEERLFLSLHHCPIKFVNSPGGSAYLREVQPPDWVLDYWHPLEKAQYPEYFARREERKKEFVKLWDEQFGNQKNDHCNTRSNK